MHVSETFTTQPTTGQIYYQPSGIAVVAVIVGWPVFLQSK
jgi:hypothetical protein